MRIFFTFLAFVAIFFMALFLGRPGAERSAIRFGKSVHSVISDKEITDWAESFQHSFPAPNGESIDIPRSKWPIPLQNLLKSNDYAKALISFDGSQKVNGVIVLNTINGIVVPLNESLPDLSYFSIHMIADSCPYFAISIYK